MKIGLITPFSDLKLSEFGDIYFCLTRQLNDNKDYYNFFKDKKMNGFEIICDNNVHEEDPMNFEQHVKLAIEVGTIIIIPDVLRDKKKNLEYFHYFMDKFFPILKENNIKIMAVPQGETIEEIRECFNEFNNDDRVDFIGNSFDLVPYNLSNDKIVNQMLNRVDIIFEWLSWTKKKIHLLGCSGLYELYFLSRFEEIYSTDGKLLSRLALSDIKIDDNWSKTFKSSLVKKMDFEDRFDAKQIEIFIRNFKFFTSKLK